MPFSYARLCLASVTVGLSFVVRQAAADTPPVAAPANTRPVSSIPEAIPPALLGTWQDDQRLLLPPNITRFEVVRSTITFAPGGSFTEVIEKAAGPLRQTGSYSVQGNRLTVNFLGGPVLYEFSPHGGQILLQRADHRWAGALIVGAVNPAGVQAKPKQAVPDAPKGH